MKDWKSHPIAIAAIATASTAAFFITVASPIIEKQNTNKIKNLEQHLATHRENLTKKEESHRSQILNLENELAEKAEAIRKQDSEISSLKSDVEKYKNEDRFSKDTPIPKGLRNLSLFSEYKKISTEYPEEKFNENTYYTPIKIKDALFSKAVYYPADCKDKKIITEIRFLYRDKFNDYQDAIETNKKKTEYIILDIPSTEEVKQSKIERKNALLKTFTEIYGPPIESENQEEIIFIINDSIAAMINDMGLHILSRFTDEELNKICNGQLICPVPNTNDATSLGTHSKG